MAALSVFFRSLEVTLFIRKHLFFCPLKVRLLTVVNWKDVSFIWPILCSPVSLQSALSGSLLFAETTTCANETPETVLAMLRH